MSFIIHFSVDWRKIEQSNLFISINILVQMAKYLSNLKLIQNTLFYYNKTVKIKILLWLPWKITLVIWKAIYYNASSYIKTQSKK